MEHADKADVARLFGEKDKSMRLMALAFEKEVAAANLMESAKDVEPTRSVLYRSAATLAWQCKMYEDAKRLIYQAKAGYPPPYIEEELDDLLGKVKLAMSEHYLSEKLLRLTLDGSAIAFGRALAGTLHDRIVGVEKMLQATADAPVQLFYDSVGTGSFFVDLALSSKTEPTLPGFDNFEIFVAPLIKHLDQLNCGKTSLLEQGLSDPKRYRDFVGAAKQLAPDGKAISSVSLQAQIEGGVQAITFERSKDELNNIPLPVIPKESSEIVPTDQLETIVGILQRADGRQSSSCELRSETGGTWTIDVHEDIVHEVLGRYWKKRVKIVGTRMKKERALKRLRLSSIEDIWEVSIASAQPTLDLL